MKALNDLRSGKEFVAYAVKHKARIRHNGGSHAVVTTEKGMCVVPVHAGDLGKGLRCKIVKLYIAIGLSLLTAIVYALAS